MKLYRALNRTPLASTYRGKLFAAIIAGSLTSVLLVLVWSLLSGARIPGPVFLVILGSVVAGSLVACLLIHVLLAPLDEAVEIAGKPRPEDTLAGEEGHPRHDLAGRLLSAVTAGASAGRAGEAAHAAVTDPLTGLNNRHWCETRLGRELVNIARGSGELVLAVIRLDRFGRIGREYGHATGDACVQRLAEVARASLRTGDWLARWGDAEFVAVLRGRRDEARPALERLQGMLARRPVTTADGEELRLGASIGAVTATGGEAVDALFRSADEAIRRARSAGRDRIAFFGD